MNEDLLKLIQDEYNAGEPIKGVLGRSTDNLVDASAETGEANTYYAQVEDSPDPRIVYGDPSVLNLYAYDANAPLKLKYEDKKLVIQGVPASQISSYYNSQTPSIYIQLITDTGPPAALSVGSTLSLLGGTGMNVTNSSTTATVTLETPVVVANGGTGRTTLTSNNLLAGNTTGTVNLIAPGSNGNVLFVSAGAFTSGTLNLDTANLSGTLALAQGGVNTSLAATGGTSFVLMQESIGANITVRQLTATDISTTGTLFTLAGSSGSSQAINRGDTLTISATAPLTTTGQATDTVALTIADFGGASSGADGSRGTVPQPTTGQQNRILTGDGTWKNTMDDVTIGGTTPKVATFTTANVNTTLNISPASTITRIVASNSSPYLNLFASITGGSPFRFSYANTDLNSPSQAVNNDVLGQVQFYGYGATVYREAAVIKAEAAESFTNSTSAGRLKFYVTPTGAVTAALALTIDQDKSATFAAGITATTGTFNPDSNTTDTFAASGVTTLKYQSNSTSPILNLYRTRASNGAAQSGDTVGQIDFQSMGDIQQTRVRIQSVATATHSSTIGSSKLEIYTTPASSEALTLAATFGADQSLAIVGGISGTTLTLNPDANTENVFTTGGVSTLEYANSNATGVTLNLYKARGNTTTESAVSSSDTLASINFQSYGDQQQTRAQIAATATETHSATAGGTKLDFYVTPNTTETPVIALTLGQDKGATFGNYVDIGTAYLAIGAGSNAGNSRLWQDSTSKILKFQTAEGFAFPLQGTFWKLLNSITVTATTETSITSGTVEGTLTPPANSAVAGTTYEFEFVGFIGATAGRLRFAVRIGGTLIAAFQSFDITTSTAAPFSIKLTAQVLNTSGTSNLLMNAVYTGRNGDGFVNTLSSAQNYTTSSANAWTFFLYWDTSPSGQSVTVLNGTAKVS